MISKANKSSGPVVTTGVIPTPTVVPLQPEVLAAIKQAALKLPKNCLSHASIPLGQSIQEGAIELSPAANPNKYATTLVLMTSIPVGSGGILDGNCATTFYIGVTKPGTEYEYLCGPFKFQNPFAQETAAVEKAINKVAFTQDGFAPYVDPKGVVPDTGEIGILAAKLKDLGTVPAYCPNVPLDGGRTAELLIGENNQGLSIVEAVVGGRVYERMVPVTSKKPSDVRWEISSVES